MESDKMVTNDSEAPVSDNHLIEPPTMEATVHPGDPAQKVDETEDTPAKATVSAGIQRSDSVGIVLQPTPAGFESTPVAMASGASQLPSTGYVDPQNYTPLDRPLNVADALSYLDDVKVKFQDQPDVYNQFLDIMKDFKSQLIETPGVIKRVSHLFNGHPALIQGFNTFLPVGYSIECSTDAQDSNFITVTTPTGTMMQTTNNGPANGPMQWSTSYRMPADVTHPPYGVSADGHLQGSAIVDIAVQDFYKMDRQAIEPAVQYVQKIKTRCDEETYRKFLDILSQYHQTSGSIDEVEVSKQISILFKDAPDLRYDFRIFMPQQSQRLLDDDAFLPPPLEGPATRTGTPTVEGRNKRKLDTASSSSGLNVPLKRKRKPVEKEKDIMTIATTAKAGLSNKKAKRAVSQDLTPSSYSHPKYDAAPSTSRRPHNSQPQPLSKTHSAATTNDESHFFDRVKRAMDNRDTYNEFLKLVNLFTQSFIDTARLIKESRRFLGDSELMRQFKEILGWDERKEREAWLLEQKQQDGWVRPLLGTVLDRPTHDDLNIKYGSYRKLPVSEMNVVCSGRDDMCRSVLNDEWVSHPSWSDEDAGFIPHKKNIYEEALHRSEEERHEYDFHIEAITRTITMLEPINNKIAQLNSEERGSFKLKPNLGGAGKAIHQRVIKKIYGREAGLEVIQAMQDSPALAIPVVLQRLKQKEEEWKRAQREWNKVWREVDARNYVKSLDHQGINFRAADKKATSTKYFVSQIEAARDEQMAQRASLIDPLFARTRPRHQLEFVMEDTAVLQDSLKLTFSFLDRTQAQINFAERRRIEGFLRAFVPLFFVLDAVSFNSAFVVVQETLDSDISDSAADDLDVSTVTTTSSKRSHRKGAGDLRKKLLKSEQAKSANRKTRGQDIVTPSTSRLASPAVLEAMDVDSVETRGDVSNQNRRVPRKNLFFTNTAFYTLLRLLQVLYSRLALYKSIATKLAAEFANTPQPNQVASNTSLDSLVDLTSLGERSKHARHFYDLLLESCERLFDNEVEQHVFEDQMRYMFGTKHAYKIFTIDKLIGTLIKQVQIVSGDSKSKDLLEILKRERSLPHPTTQDQINSRRNAEKILGPDENIFRVDWRPDSKTMTFQLIGKDDSKFDDSEVLTGRWQAYIDSFVSSGDTENVPSSRIRPPFLRKNRSPAPQGSQPGVVAQGALEIKVCVRTYRIFYVSKTEELMWRLSNRPEIQRASQQLKARNSLRKKWMDRLNAGELFQTS